MTKHEKFLKEERIVLREEGRRSTKEKFPILSKQTANILGREILWETFA